MSERPPADGWNAKESRKKEKIPVKPVKEDSLKPNNRQMDSTGMTWETSRVWGPDQLRVQEIRAVVFRPVKVLPDFVFHDGYLEGNPVS